MKIIKQGIPQQKPDDKLYTGSCYNCGCEVECKQSETMFHQSGSYPGFSNCFVQCPNKYCDSIITVELKKNTEDTPRYLL